MQYLKCSNFDTVHLIPHTKIILNNESSRAHMTSLHKYFWYLLIINYNKYNLRKTTF